MTSDLALFWPNNVLLLLQNFSQLWFSRSGNHMLGNNFVVILVISWHVRDRKPTYRLQYLLYTATKFGLNEVGCCLIDTETDRVGLKVSEVQLMHDNNEFSTRIHCWCDLHGMCSDVLPRYKCCHDQWMGPFKRIRYFIKIIDLRSSSFKQWKWVILHWVFLKSLRCYTIKIIILHRGFLVIGLN